MSIQTKKFSSKQDRNEEIIKLYLAETPIKELISQFSLTKQSIYNIIKNYGVLPRKPPQSKSEIEKRNLDIASSFKSGIPMTELASTYGMTRQGIQLILKHLGMNAKAGGASIRSKERQLNLINNKILNRERNCNIKWGCTLDQWQTLRNMNLNFHLTPIARYIQHRSNVKRQNIDWHISLWQWWTIWNTSGLYNSRGRGKNGYCMTRLKDQGPYTYDNVYITTISKNLKDGFIDRRICKN